MEGGGLTYCKNVVDRSRGGCILIEGVTLEASLKGRFADCLLELALVVVYCMDLLKGQQ